VVALTVIGSPFPGYGTAMLKFNKRRPTSGIRPCFFGRSQAAWPRSRRDHGAGSCDARSPQDALPPIRKTANREQR